MIFKVVDAGLGIYSVANKDLPLGVVLVSSTPMEIEDPSCPINSLAVRLSSLRCEESPRNQRMLKPGNPLASPFRGLPIVFSDSPEISTGFVVTWIPGYTPDPEMLSEFVQDVCFCLCEYIEEAVRDRIRDFNAHKTSGVP